MLWLVLQADSGEPPPKRVRMEAGDDAATKELPGEEKASTENGEGDAQQPDRVPISDLDTLQELASISGGCCICTLR